MWIWLCVIAASVLVDQLTKLWTVATLGVGESVDFIPGVLRFTYIQNEGAAFGMLSEHRWVFMIVSTVAIGALLVYLWKFRPDSLWACTAISLIIGGGIGNMIDRVRLSYVIDMIDFCAFPKLWMWVFNIADACVCVGAGILFVWLIVSMIKEAKQEKAKKQNGEQDV
ncbi:MAG: signal peptidase II [Clostridia bacterium]|nr:signal peptidase II [Clostridia bacterium]